MAMGSPAPSSPRYAGISATPRRQHHGAGCPALPPSTPRKGRADGRPGASNPLCTGGLLPAFAVLYPPHSRHSGPEHGHTNPTSSPAPRGDNEAHNDGYRDEHDEPIQSVQISHSRTVAHPRNAQPLSFGQPNIRRVLSAAPTARIPPLAGRHHLDRAS